MAGRKVVVSIAADTKKFRRAFKQLGQASGISALGGKIVKIGKAMAVAGAAAAAGAVLIGKKLWEAGETAGTANARIENIANSMGVFGNKAGEVAKRLQELADKTALQTGFDQTAIKETQAKLLTFKELAVTAGQVGGAFDRATQAAIDMAAAGFGTAQQNAVQLGKALNDPVKGITALNRSGINFTETEKEKIKTLVKSNKMGEAQAYVLAAIEKQVKGTALATANASDKFKVFAAQVWEHVGLKVTPVFDKLADIAVKALPSVIAFVDKGLAKLSKIAGQVGKSFTQKMLPPLKETWESVKNTALPLASQIAGVIVTYVIPALTNIGVAITQMLPAIAQAIEFINNWKIVIIPLAAVLAAPVVALIALHRAIKTARAAIVTFNAANKLAHTVLATVKGDLGKAKTAYTKLKTVVGKTGKVIKATGRVVKIAGKAFLTLAKNIAKATLAAARNSVAWVAAKAKMLAHIAVMAAHKVATMAMTAAQWALNAALNANPIGLVVIAITALVAVLVVLYTKSQTVRNVINTVWNGIKNVVSSTANYLSSLLHSTMASIKNLWSSGWRGIERFLKNTWNSIKNSVSSSISSVTSTMRALPGKILSALGNMKNLLYQAGKDLIQGLINGVGAMGQALYNKLTSLGHQALAAMKKALGIKSPSREFMKLGVWTGKGFIKGLGLMEEKTALAAKSLANASINGAKTSFLFRPNHRPSPASQPVVINLNCLRPDQEAARMIENALISRGLLSGRKAYA